MEVLLISTARNILNAESRERDRMRLYANHVDQLHIIVFTQRDKAQDNETNEGNLHLYPTNSKNKAFALIDAYLIGRRIVKKNRNKSLTISAQDPLWTGWLAWTLSKLKNTRLHIQLHGDYFGSEWSKGSVRRKLAKWTAAFLVRRAPMIKVVSERIKGSLVDQGIDESKIIVLPIRPELEKFIERRHTYAEKQSYSFLFVGRFAPEKDINRILSAFAETYKVRQDITLRLVGDGEGLSSINHFIKAKKLEDVVKVTGWTEDVPDMMANADIFLLASKHEAYGLVLLEAMASGLPIISTDVGCVGEVVKDGVHGIIVQNSGVKPYIDAMQKILNDPETRKTYGERGRETAVKIAEISMDEYANAWVSTMSQ